MIAIIIGLFFTITQSAPDLSCDGVAYALGSVNVAIAAGVCEGSSTSGSSMFICESRDVISVATYSTDDCSGNPTSTTPFTDSVELLNITDYSINCCSGNQCDYSMESTYTVSDCSDDTSNLTPTYTIVYPSGVCAGLSSLSYTMSCENAVRTQTNYNNGDCSGSSLIDIEYSDGDCDSSTNEKISVECGTAVNTCSSTDTSEPTLSPTISTDNGSPTAAPVISDGTCDGVEYSLGTIKVFIAAGVCDTDSDGSSSSMYVCDSSNSISTELYSSEDCSGNPLSTVPFSSTVELLNLTDYTITCCSGNQCDYATTTSYTANDCSADISGLTGVSKTFVLDKCLGLSSVAYEYTSCENGELTKENYIGSDDYCEGSATSTVVSNDGDCDALTKVITGIECGTAINTCDGTTNPSDASRFMVMNFILYVLAGICVYLV